MSTLMLSATALAQEPDSAGNGCTMIVLQSVYIPPLAHAPFSSILHAEWTTKLWMSVPRLSKSRASPRYTLFERL